MTAKLCFVALDHRNDEYLTDLVTSIRRFCPSAHVYWYDSAPIGSTQQAPVATRLPCSRPLEYAKVTPFFFDMFEWATDHGYEYIVNVESDMAFINHGFAAFASNAMADCDYLASGFARRVPKTSKWRPYHSLRKELPELLEILGIDYTNRGFSPGQVFSARYIGKLVESCFYPQLRAFVERNQEPGRSFTLQEVLLPTLADVLRLPVRGYPAHLSTFNRYRPYHAVKAVAAARQRGDVHFVHPIRRASTHPARSYIRSLCEPH